MSIETPRIRGGASLTAGLGCGRARRSTAPSHRAARCGTPSRRSRRSPARAGSPPSRAAPIVGMDASAQAGVSRCGSPGSKPKNLRPSSVIQTLSFATSQSHSANCALSTARLMRSSLTRNASFERRSSSIATASSISGVAAISRNNCSANAFSAGVCVRNGPRPCIVPQIASIVTTSIEALMPPSPKRSAAQMSRGTGA